jgi:hypothetical protein
MMEVRKMHGLIRHWRDRHLAIKEKEDQLAEDTATARSEIKRIKEALKEVVSKKEGAQKKVPLNDKSATVSAVWTDKYNIVDRDELEDWIMEGVPQKYQKKLRSRLQVFGKGLNGDYCRQHRADSGAEEINEHLQGGTNVPGTGVYTNKDVRLWTK